MMRAGLLGDLVAGPRLAKQALAVTAGQKMTADLDECRKQDLEALRRTRMLAIQYVIDFQKPYFPWARRVA